MKLAVLPGADEGRFVQALQSESECERHEKARHEGIPVERPYMQGVVANPNLISEKRLELQRGQGQLSARYTAEKTAYCQANRQPRAATAAQSKLQVQKIKQSDYWHDGWHFTEPRASKK